MSDSTSLMIPKSFYGIAIAAILWNLFGVLAYLGQVTISPETIAELPLEQQALYQDIPIWATSAYAIAVNAGVIGSILLLMRRVWALYLFVVSFVGVIVQFSHAMLMPNMLAVAGIAGALFSIVITVIAILLIWYAVYAKNQGWLR